LDDTPDPAARFTDMARKITENANNGFSGAFVIIPPDGNAIDLLYLAGQTDAAVFWSTAKTMIEIEIGKIQDRDRQRTTGW
jgi:hypothetical protein